MHLPLFIDLRGKKALVVGLGRVGSRRARKLRDAGAEVTAIDRRVKNLEGVKIIRNEVKADNLPSLKNYFLVVAATNNGRLNAAIAEKARREGVLVNRADDFRDGDVAFPAAVRTKKNIISITTLGKNPRLSKRIKELLERAVSED